MMKDDIAGASPVEPTVRHRRAVTFDDCTARGFGIDWPQEMCDCQRQKDNDQGVCMACGCVIGRQHVAQRQQVPSSPYGYCPVCGAAGKSRERRVNGNDECLNGHSYPSRNAITAAPSAQAEPDEWQYKRWDEEDGWGVWRWLPRNDLPQFRRLAAEQPNRWQLRALYAAPPAAQAEPQVPLTDEHISALYVSGWGAYCSRASFIAIFREAERVYRIGKQESK